LVCFLSLPLNCIQEAEEALPPTTPAVAAAIFKRGLISQNEISKRKKSEAPRKDLAINIEALVI